MDKQWASENLQVIRTLMERAAIYRRALAPLMIIAGTLGLLGGMVAWVIPIKEDRYFSLFWMSISLVTMLVCFLQVRRQAWQAKEAFWSPPTRRVAHALGPVFCAGLASGVLWVVFADRIPVPVTGLAAIWLICYGCGLNAAGFFMVRGIRLFGWIFVVSGSVLLFSLMDCPVMQDPQAGNLLMGVFFGLSHLAYGIYLYFTEKTRNPL